MESLQISDVFFDLDHTLWDFEKNSALAFRTIFEKHEMEIDLEEFLSHYIPLNLAYWEKYRKAEISQEELRYRRLKEAFDLMEVYIDDGKILQLSDDYIHFLPQYNHLLESASEILEYLNAKYRLHIITNGFQEIQQNKLKNSNIGHYFQTVTDSEKAGVKKPDSRIFEFALEYAGAKKETSIMIGDCIEADVNGALQCGIDAILFSEKPCGIATIRQISHLSELKKYL